MAGESDPVANSFSHHFCVQLSDIDELGHVGNVTWVRFVNDVATAHSHSVGLDLAAYRALGVLWVVRRHDIQYLRSAVEGDHVSATTWISSARGASSVRHTEFRREGTLLVLAMTRWVSIRIDSGRPTRVPQSILHRFKMPTGRHGVAQDDR